MYGHSKPPIELTGKLTVTTAKAYQFHADMWDEPEWLPKSQCAFNPDVDGGESGTMQIPAWLAKKNGWSEI